MYHAYLIIGRNPYFVKKYLASLDKNIKIRMQLQEILSPFVHEFISSFVPTYVNCSKYYGDVGHVFVYLSKLISGVETGLD